MDGRSNQKVTPGKESGGACFFCYGEGQLPEERDGESVGRGGCFLVQGFWSLGREQVGVLQRGSEMENIFFLGN